MLKIIYLLSLLSFQSREISRQPLSAMKSMKSVVVGLIVVPAMGQVLPHYQLLPFCCASWFIHHSFSRLWVGSGIATHRVICSGKISCGKVEGDILLATESWWRGTVHSRSKVGRRLIASILRNLFWLIRDCCNSMRWKVFLIALSSSDQNVSQSAIWILRCDKLAFALLSSTH